MKKRTKYSLAVFIICLVIVYGIGLLGSIFSAGESKGEWYESVRPAITPPSWIFPIVWNLLFLLIALALWISWVGADKKEKKRITFWYGLNLIANAFWSLFYFGMHNVPLAFVDLIIIWLTIVGMIRISWKINKGAGLLLVPYLLWVSFAGVLNYLSLG